VTDQADCPAENSTETDWEKRLQQPAETDSVDLS